MVAVDEVLAAVALDALQFGFVPVDARAERGQPRALKQLKRKIGNVDVQQGPGWEAPRQER